MTMEYNPGVIAVLTKYDRLHPEHAGTNGVEKMLLYGLVRYLRPEEVIEIGISAGHSTCWIAQAIKDNKRGKLIAVDNFSRTHGGAAQTQRAVDTRLRENNLRKYVKIVETDSLEFLRGRPNDSAEIVWVDGGHSYDQAKMDAVEALRVASDLVIVHDSNQQAYTTVREACTDVERELNVRGTFIDGHRGMWICNANR